MAKKKIRKKAQKRLNKVLNKFVKGLGHHLEDHADEIGNALEQAMDLKEPLIKKYGDRFSSFRWTYDEWEEKTDAMCKMSDKEGLETLVNSISEASIAVGRSCRDSQLILVNWCHKSMSPEDGLHYIENLGNVPAPVKVICSTAEIIKEFSSLAMNSLAASIIILMANHNKDREEAESIALEIVECHYEALYLALVDKYKEFVAKYPDEAGIWMDDQQAAG